VLLLNRHFGKMRLMVLALVLDFVTSSPLNIVSDENDDICNSPDCIATSERLLKYMNLSVDPCDDFYQVINNSVLTN
jgi:hypothetical protein